MARDDGGAAATIITAFLLGAVTGAAVALLVAPATGEETRRKLGDKAREGADAASGAARQGREFVERGRSTVLSAIERGREAYEQARSAGSPVRPQGPASPGAQPRSTGSGPEGEAL